MVRIGDPGIDNGQGATGMLALICVGMALVFALALTHGATRHLAAAGSRAGCPSALLSYLAACKAGDVNGSAAVTGNDPHRPAASNKPAPPAPAAVKTDRWAAGDQSDEAGRRPQTAAWRAR